MKRNKFSLSHYKLLTCDMGYLIPLTWYEALPGDTIQQSTSLLLRVSPLLAPVMHPVKVRIHHWFVPNRLLWSNWEDFITGGPDGEDASTHPYKSINGPITESTLHDYMGVPSGVAFADGPMLVNALPLRAYNLIFNEYYRDQDLVTELAVLKTDGADATVFTLQSCAWEKDYFTTARAEESKGAEVTIPLVGDAPIYGIGSADQTWAAGPVNAYETETGVRAYANYKNIAQNDANNLFYAEKGTDSNPAIYADLESASAVSINDLRLALAIQRYQEARNMYGSRYVEYLRYLGVRSSDARLQKPEYLGGGRQVIQFSEVLDHTSAGTLGAMGGHGIAAMRTNRYRRFFEEHGIVMTIMSVVPKSIYADGIPKRNFREVKEDYYQKELAHLGDQEVLCRELYCDAADQDDVFGYQARYDEYRTMESSIAGEFRTSLDHWHMARIFGAEPSLNSTFVTCSPTKRILAADSTDGLYVMANHSIQARRMLPKVARPKTF